MSEYANRSARARSPVRTGGDADEKDDVGERGDDDERGDDEATLRSLLESPRERDRRDAALALVDRAEDGLQAETADALADRLAEDRSDDVRQFAVEALGVAGEAEDAIRTALSDDDEWVRSEAVVALSRVAPGADALAGALDDDSGWVRRNAVIALGKTGRANPETLADRIENDPHPAVREYAALYLGETAKNASEEAESEAVRLLAAVLARDPAAFTRAKAAESLGELATDRAERALERHGITDRSDDVKRTAKRSLASARGVDPDRLDVVRDDGPPGGGPQSMDDLPDGPGPSAEATRTTDRGPQRDQRPGRDERPGNRTER